MSFSFIQIKQTVSCDGFSARTHAHRTLQYSRRTHIARTCAFFQNSIRTRTHTCAIVRVRFAKIHKRTRTFVQNER